MKKFLLLPLLAVLVLPVFAQEQSSSAAADASGEILIEKIIVRSFRIWNGAMV